MIEFIPLASSSDGNCYVVKCAQSCILIDPGIPYKNMQKLLWAKGMSVSKMGGTIVSHSHGDHTAGVKELLAKTGVPVFASSSPYYHCFTRYVAI
jgi:glyoxylase-like metal-dependent hydrolase (beta-lactamase superfamily II)